MREASRGLSDRDDDWVVGVAPLASPETLSEASSIVSRASLLLREGRRAASLTQSSSHQQTPSPLLNHRPPPARLGMGYCFYVETPPLEARRQQLIAAERLPESSDDEEIPHRPLSPTSYITLEPIIPTPPPKTPVPADNESPVTHNPSSATNCEVVTHSPVQDTSGPSHSQEGASGGRASPDSPGSGHSPDSSSSSSSSSTSTSSSSSSQISHRVKFDFTASQMSRDSGYGERLNGNLSGASGEWGAGGVGGWAGHQQEYGRGQASLVHHYMYSGISPQHSPLSPANTDSFTSPLTSDPPSSRPPSLLPTPVEVPRLGSSNVTPAGIHHNPHPLYKATPLLHDISRSPKVIPSVSRTPHRAESSV